ncbi:MAG: class II aldolase/adducin family protein [candidate division Zixibacteria bacterium]|nr:class II aldolase/adducin family protein [candidate division Zixibacteria bacterium]
MINASPFIMRKAVAEFGTRLYEQQMIAGTDGNLSVRLGDDRVLVTPSGLPKGRLAPEDMVIVDMNGKHLQGSHKASAELAMHLLVYQRRSEVNAVIHAHPPHATAFAVAGIGLESDVLPEVVVSVGKIPLTDYAGPGTDEVPKSIEPHVDTCNAFLLRNHGLLTVGRSLDEAYNRHEVVEHYARIVLLARHLGNIDAIPGEDFRRLERMRENLDKTWDPKV